MRPDSDLLDVLLIMEDPSEKLRVERALEAMGPDGFAVKRHFLDKADPLFKQLHPWLLQRHLRKLGKVLGSQCP